MRRGVPPPHAAARTLAPAAVLFAILVAHSVLETARDSLFLSRLQPGALALAYLVMAGCALAAIAIARRSLRLRDPRRALLAFLSVATVGTGLLAASITTSDTVVFTLYVWTGLVATLVVPSFWVAIDRAFAISEAKRVFGVIGAGGVVGAMTGSAIAAAVGRYSTGSALVWVGTAGFAAATLLAWLLIPLRTVAEPPARPSRVAARSHAAHRYVRALVGLAVVGTVALTLGDMTFKLVVARHVAGRDLAAWFGGTYTALNAVALVIQVAVTARLLARWGIGAVLAVLPTILLLGAGGFALTGALLAVVVLKLGDGALRHSVHRVASEILYVPVPSAVRDGGKLIADALGQRGGQAIAAVVAGTIVFLGGSVHQVAVATTIAAALWLLAVVRVRRAYVRQLRAVLKAGDIQRDVAVPELDAASAELLEGSIGSDDETEALAALDLLARRTRVPTAALRDRRELVVRHALSLLTGELSDDAAAALAALDQHAEPHVRAAALAARAAAGSDLEVLLRARTDQAVEVRAVAFVHLVRYPEHLERASADIAALANGPADARLALVEAIAFAPSPRFSALLEGFLDADEPTFRRAVLATLKRAPELANPVRLIGLLGSPTLRQEVREVLVACGTSALELLIAALDARDTPAPVRVHLPRTIALFRSDRATLALSRRIGSDLDDRTADKLLRALARLRGSDPTLAIDTLGLHSYLERSIQRASHYATLHAEIEAVPAERSHTLDLIRELLFEKYRIALERSLRVLGVLEPAARSAIPAVGSDDDARLAAAHELVDVVAPRRVRPALLQLLEHRTAIAARRTLEEIVEVLLVDPSESLRCAVALHVEEARLVGVADARPAAARERLHA